MSKKKSQMSKNAGMGKKFKNNGTKRPEHMNLRSGAKMRTSVGASVDKLIGRGTKNDYRLGEMTDKKVRAMKKPQKLSRVISTNIKRNLKPTSKQMSATKVLKKINKSRV